MRASTVSSVSLLAALILALAAQSGDAAQKREPLPAELSFRQLDGQSISMGELRGKAVLFDFWATWCAPCRDALPHLRVINTRFEDKPFALLSISVDESRPVLEKFLADEKAEWPHIWDGNGQITRTFGVRSFPTYLIVDHTGRITSSLSGWGSRHEMRLAQLVGAEVSKATRAAKKKAK